MGLWDILAYLFIGLLGIALTIVATLFLAVCFVARDDDEMERESHLRDGT